MTAAEEGGYWRLLCHAWGEPDCCLRDDDGELAQLSRLGPAWLEGSGQKIRACFTPDPNRPGFIFNERQREVRTEQAHRVETARDQRKAAANARWHPAKREQCDRNATVEQPQCGRNASYSSPSPSDKAYKLLKGGKLRKSQRGLCERFEAALGDQWMNDAGKWVNRIKADSGKSERVIAEIESAKKESRITATPAQFAEDTWKHFA